MSSKLYDILNKLTVDSPIGTKYFYEEQRVLLWENSSPTSSFAAQTVSLSLSDYDWVELTPKGLHGNVKIDFKGANTSGVSNGVFLYMMGSTTFFDTACRRFKVTTTGVSFEDSYIQRNSFASLYIDNVNCVPYKIYGVKKIG